MHDSLNDIQHYLGAFAEETLENGIGILLPYIDDIYLPLNAFTLGLGVTGIAHGTEILIKSAIANAHPLLLFDYKGVSRKPPKDDRLELVHLFDRQSIAFDQLPYALWAATEFKIADTDVFDSFRELRNKIEHFCVPNERPHDLLKDAVSFLFFVVNPILKRFFSSDVWTLVRPYGVSALHRYASLKGINVDEPDWLSRFDLERESKSIAEIRQLSESHRIATKKASRRCSHYVVNGLSLVVPAEHQATANRRSIRIEGNTANIHSYSVPLSPTGDGNATHYSCHTPATEEIAIRCVRLVASLGGDYEITKILEGEACHEVSSWQSHIERLNLKRIEVSRY